MLNPLELLVKDILDSTQKLDEKFSRNVSPGYPVYGLHILPGLVFILKHFVLVIRRYSVEEYFSHYDHLILLLPHFISIRAVRFSGKQLIDPNSSFIIEKLEKQKGKESRIGKDLPGSFITQGKLTNIDSSFLQMFTPMFFGLIRPLILKDKYEGIVLPSPLSLLSHEYFSQNSSKHVFISPCSLTVLLKNFQYKREFQVLDMQLKGFLSKGATIFGTDSSGYVVNEQIDIFLPDEDFADPRFREYATHGTPVLTHLLGIMIFDEKFPLIRNGSGGYFLALQEIPYPLSAETLAICGKLSKFAFRSPLSQGREYEHYYAIECEAHEKSTFQQNVQRFLSSIRRKNNAYSSLEEQMIGEATQKYFSSIFYILEKNTIKLLAPPIIMLSLTQGYDIQEVYKKINKLQQLSESTGIEAQIEILQLRNSDPILKTILPHTQGPWKDSFTTQSQLAEKWKLKYII